jgi:hypothetical protein
MRAARGLIVLALVGACCPPPSAPRPATPATPTDLSGLGMPVAAASTEEILAHVPAGARDRSALLEHGGRKVLVVWQSWMFDDRGSVYVHVYRQDGAGWRLFIGELFDGPVEIEPAIDAGGTLVLRAGAGALPRGTVILSLLVAAIGDPGTTGR